MSYEEIYQNRIRYFDKDIPSFLLSINNNESIALCSTPGAGDERFLDYLSYKLNETKKYTVIQLDDTQTNLDGIIHQIEKQKKSPIIVLAPYFYHNPSEQGNLLLSLKQHYNKGELITIIKLDKNYYLHPEQYTNFASLTGNLMVRKPLAKNEVKEAISIRNQLHNWHIPQSDSDEYYRLSGGLLRLIKRIGSYQSQTGSLALEELVLHPPIQTILADIAVLFEHLPKSRLQSLGLIDKQQRVLSKLLDYHLRLNHLIQPELSPQLSHVFNLLLANRNRLVTDEQVNQATRSRSVIGSGWANYKLISRLRQQLHGKYKIRTVRGKGYILSDA